MSVFADRRARRDLAGSGKSRVGWVGRGTCLACLLALVGLCWIASGAVAGSDESPASVGQTAPIRRVIEYLSGKTIVATPATEKSSHSERLVTETEKPEDYQRIVAESPYPPTDSPENLTLEQLEAIAKLAPKASKAGIQAHPAVVPLFRSMILRYTGGTYKNTPIRFRLHTPEPYREGTKYPMVVWLHGAGECGSDNIDQLSHLHHIIPHLVGPKKRDFFLLVPQCPHSHTTWEAPEICSTRIRTDGRVECHVTKDSVALGNAPVAFTLAMIEAVMKEFPVDPNHVTIGGLSTGGKGVWRILERRPDLFAAAAPIVSWEAMQEMSLREKPLLKKIPIWAIYSSDDNAIDFARKEFERMRESGCRVFKTEFGVCGHRAWTPAMLQGDVFGWLLSRAKDGDRFFTAEESPTSPEKIGIFADVTEGDLKRQPTKAPVRPKQAVELEGLVPRPETIGEGTPGPEPYRPTVVTGTPTTGLYRPTAVPGTPGPGPYRPTASGPVVRKDVAVKPLAQAAPWQPSDSLASGPTDTSVEQLRLELIARYIAMGEIKKAMAAADKVRNRQELVRGLLHGGRELPPEMLDYLDRELDRMVQQGEMAGAASPSRAIDEDLALPKEDQLPRSRQKPLEPIPAGAKLPKDACGKEWAMSPITLYGLFPNGWDQEANHVPGYVINETGKQLRDRLAKAFAENDLAVMKEFCESFIRLDDIPLSSPWFDTSGGRLQGRIKYTLNEKAKPVVELLREIADVKAEAKQEFVELARKSLERMDAITHPKSDK